MKYLITENRFNSVAQKLINDTLNEFRNVCEIPDADTWPGWLNFDDCDTLESIEKIQVVNSEQVKSVPGLIKITSKYTIIGVDVDIYFSNIFASQDFSDFLISLAYRIKQKYKIQLNFIENELINTNTNRQR
jgi:hypothetical protein